MFTLLILVPFAAVLILNLPPKALMRRAAFWVVALLALAQAVLVLWHPAEFWSRIDPFDQLFNFKLSADGLSQFMLLSIAVVVFSALLAGRYTIEGQVKRFNFTNLVLIAMTGMNVLVMATDIFSLYAFLEISAISVFILIAAK